MSNYYVSTAGSDSTGNGSLSNPWRTIGKAIGVSPAITLSGTGDTLYIAPGVYREAVTFSLSPTSAGRLTIAGDVSGSAFGVAAGVVEWRAWSDDVTPLASQNLTAFSKSFTTIKSVKFTGGNPTSNQSIINFGGGTDWTIQDCLFVTSSGRAAIWLTPLSAIASNLTVERCIFAGDYRAVFLAPPLSTAEYSMNVMVRSCLFIGMAGVFVQPGGSGAGLPTGVTLQGSTAIAGRLLVLNYPNSSLTTPLGCYGNLGVWATTYLIGAINTSQVAEDGNLLLAATPRSLVNAGANSITSACPSLDFLDGFLTGLPLRPFAEPTPGSPALAFGNFGSPTTDLFNQARPATASAGALERETLPGGSTTYIFNSES